MRCKQSKMFFNGVLEVSSGRIHLRGRRIGSSVLCLC
jgi:hypothetical protein